MKLFHLTRLMLSLLSCLSNHAPMIDPGDYHKHEPKPAKHRKHSPKPEIFYLPPR